MADNRKQYLLTMAGVEHTVLLTPQDAERYGELAVEFKAVKATANKARRAPANKSAAAAPEADQKPAEPADTE